MAALKQDKDKKRLPKAAPAKLAAAGPKVAADKGDLRAVMRPAAPEPGALKVGAANDRAEAEADKVAEALVAPAGKQHDSDAKDGKKDSKEADETAARGFPIRGPPEEGGLIRRAPDPTGGQPNLDDLNAVPSLPGNLADVKVAPDEDADLGEMTSDDWSSVSAGGSVQMVRTGAAPRTAFLATADVSQRIRNPDAGSPLPLALRADFEWRLGVDLSAVRVHSGAPARLLAASLGARAFAHRNHIWVRSGSMVSDRRLMAHEVVHVVQQGAAPRRRLQQPHAARAPPPTRPRQQCHRLARGPPASASAITSHDPLPIAEERHAHVRRDAGGADSGFLARGAESLADRLDSYQLLKAIIGRRLFTGETLSPSTDGLLGPFMKFVGAEETYEQMKKSGSLQRGYEFIKGSLASHDLSWNRVKRVFADAYDNFSWTSPIESFKQIFVPFFRDVLAFGLDVLKTVAEFIAEAFVISFGPMGRSVWEKIRSVGDNIKLIIADPAGFAKNLIRAVVKGVQGFGDRIWTHIKAGLLAWLLGPFAAMGIALPDKLDLKGIVSVILQVLGLTYPQLRPRIVKKLEPNGNVKVTFIERMIEAIQIMRTEGLAGIWRKLMEYVQNLQMTVIGGIRDWVIKAVVQAGISKLALWSNPAGALIDILLTIYNVIVFFVEKFQQILDFATTVFDAIGRIARGEIDPAATAVEKTLAQTIPIIISFLVRLLRLPDIGATVRGIVTKIQEKVHAAFEKALDWIISKVKKLVAALVSKFRGGKEPGKVAFTLDGHQHHMWAKRQGKSLELTMSCTEEHKINETDDEKSKKAIAASEESADTAAKASLVASDKQGDEVLAKTKKLSGKSETQQELPSEQDKIAKSISEYTAIIEKASQKPAGAPPAKPGQKCGEPEPPDGHGATDRTDYPFRHVVRLNNRPLEGAAGSWEQVTQEFNASRDSQPSQGRQDVSRNLSRDHIPEFVLLKKIATIYLAPAVREGTTAKKTPYLFGTLAKNLPYPKTKESNPLLPVMVIRAFVNQKVGAQSALLTKLDTEFTETSRGLEPKKAPKTDKQRQALVDSIVATYGNANVSADMASHVAEIRKAYQAMGPVTINLPEMEKTIQTATSTLTQQTNFIFGKGDAATYKAGFAKEVKVPLSDEMVKAELMHGQYNKLPKAKDLGEAGGYLERHHLLEKEVIEAFKKHGSKLATLGDYLEAELDGIIETACAASLGKQADAEKAAVAAAPEKLTKIKLAVRKASTGLDCAMKYRAEQGAHDNGVAIMVLNTVNAQAGSQGVAGLDAGIGQLKEKIANAARNSLSTALGGAFDAVLPELAKGKATAATAAAAAQAALSGAGLQQRMANDATLEGKALFSALTGSAWEIWRPLQERVNKSLIDHKEKLAPDVYKERIEDQCLKRFGELTKSKVVDANISNWFT